MNHEFSPFSLERLASCWLAAGLLACCALAGCKQADPLEAIRQQHAAGEFATSIAPLRELLETRPDDPELNFLYGRALAVEQPNLAIWSLRKAMADPQWLVPAGSQLAFLALAALDFNEALEVTNRVLEVDPDNTRVLMMQANAYAHSKIDPKRAIEISKRIFEIDPNFSEAYEPLILGLLALGKLDEAKVELEKAGELLKQLGAKEHGGVLAWHCVTLAMFLQENKEVERAHATWVSCIETHPVDADVVTNAVKYFDAHGEPDRSLEILRAAHAGDPSSRLFRNDLVERLYAVGDAAGAEAALIDPTQSDDPNIAIAGWIDLAKFRQALGDYPGGAEAMKHAVEYFEEQDEPNPQVLFGYADALVLAKDFDRAQEVAKELSLPAHRHLIQGRVAQERRNPTLALAEFDQALELWPDNPWARYHAALAADELGDFDRSLTELRESIRVDPAATDARTRAAQLLLAKGNPRAAYVVLQIAAGESPLEVEGLLLGMRLSAILDNTTGLFEFLKVIEKRNPLRAGQGLAMAADALAERDGPETAVSMLIGAPGIDFGNPRYAQALRALVRHSHAAGQPPESRKALGDLLRSLPDSGEYQGIRALDLELTGAPENDVRAAYLKALEADPTNVRTLADLGRISLRSDPAAAVAYYERAAAGDPTDPALALAAARALIALGKLDEAKQRLDALLLEHPYEGAAAAERARLDLAQGVATEQSLERARRAVRLGGGADALELLSKVLAKRNEPKLAARASEEAQALRNRKPSGS
jgi:tetratricopeptide (TPR) repeat protein